MLTAEESPVEFQKAKGKSIPRARPTSKKAAAEAAALGDTFTDRGGRVYRYVVPKKLGMAEGVGLACGRRAELANTIDIDIAEDGTARIKK